MKKLQNIFVIILLITGSVHAQQVNTLYFLENAPMRHLVNPAFQPVSEGYANLTPLGYTSIWFGNNSLTVSDLLYSDKSTKKTITAFHPNRSRQSLLHSIRKKTLTGGETSMNILGFGFRYKEVGYIHINVLQHGNISVTTPKSLYTFLLNGGMKGITKDLNQSNHIDLSKLSSSNSIYTEISGGYSHKLNEQWTIGGKVKFLLGQAYLGWRNKDLTINASMDKWDFKENGDIVVAGPINMDALPQHINQREIDAINIDELIRKDNIATLLKPSGYGAAIDFGFAYKPIEQVQITAAITNLGFIYWSNSCKYTTSIDTSFTSFGDFGYGDYVINNSFQMDSMLNEIGDNIARITDAVHTKCSSKGFARMINMNFNVGVDANFWNNRVGVGVVSCTRLIDSRLYEELTLGASFRPINWFNMAVSYSLIQNGKFSNIGAGLSFMPYDGINLTLAMDYIPTSYASTDINDKRSYIIPYKTTGVNLALGFTVVWGTNKKKNAAMDTDSDKIATDAGSETTMDAGSDKITTDTDSDKIEK